jgi:hypothetical protein
VAGPVERSGAEWSGVVSPGNLRNENIGTPWEKTMGNLWGFLGDFWEIYVFFFKGNLILGKSMFFFFENLIFFRNPSFLDMGKSKKPCFFWRVNTKGVA